MLANWVFSLSRVLTAEGGYVNDPQDPGGATNLGVTIGEAKAIGLDVNHDGKVNILDIKALTADNAGKVYKHFYWDRIDGDALPSGLDLALFDFAVNSGPVKAAITLQTILHVAADGAIGPVTIAATQRGGYTISTLVNRVCDDRLNFLRHLTTFQRFGKGWTSRVEAVRKDALRLAAGH